MLTRPKIEELLQKNKRHRCKHSAFGDVCVKIIAIADLPTRFGNFQIVAFYNDKDNKEHVAIVKGDVCGKKNVPTRIHSECFTGDVAGSLRCDCRDQLTVALEKIGKMPVGMLLYLRQEGRGIGLANKIKAYALQDVGYDTFEADHLLGFSGDEREYGVAAHMLHSLNVQSVKLMTNNPSKIAHLEKHGIVVTARLPHIIPANKYNRAYLETKERKGGHIFEHENGVIEQSERLIIE